MHALAEPLGVSFAVERREARRSDTLSRLSLA
jgi:hypothetical protein